MVGLIEPFRLDLLPDMIIFDYEIVHKYQSVCSSVKLISLCDKNYLHKMKKIRLTLMV